MAAMLCRPSTASNGSCYDDLLSTRNMVSYNGHGTDRTLVNAAISNSYQLIDNGNFSKDGSDSGKNSPVHADSKLRLAELAADKTSPLARKTSAELLPPAYDLNRVDSDPDWLIKKAEEELHEKVEWRERDIDALKDLVVAVPDLNANLDRHFLLRFLRARKFDYERALKLILSYYRMQQARSDLFDNLFPSTLSAHTVLGGIGGVLPHRGEDGCLVCFVKVQKWLPASCSIEDIFRSTIVVFDWALCSEETQINGFRIIVDLRGFGFTHLRQISPTHCRMMAGSVQNVIPGRFKGFHMINESRAFDVVLALIKPFLNAKLRNRFFNHGSNYNQLHQYVRPEYLPCEWGGTAPTPDGKLFHDALLRSEGYFRDRQRFGFKH